MAKKLSEFPIHLGLGATAVAQPEMTGGLDWYEGYGVRHGSDGAEGRLVSMHIFTENWDVWEMHPNGHEIVICTSGEITIIQKVDDKEKHVKLVTGEYAINDPGVWHTANVDDPVSALFITAGIGTEHRER